MVSGTVSVSDSNFACRFSNCETDSHYNLVCFLPLPPSKAIWRYCGVESMREQGHLAQTESLSGTNGAATDAAAETRLVIFPYDIPASIVYGTLGKQQRVILLVLKPSRMG